MLKVSGLFILLCGLLGSSVAELSFSDVFDGETVLMWVMLALSDL